MIVRIKGVKPVHSRGHTYYYHRKTMTRLPGLPGSVEFMSKLRSLETKGLATLPGTLGGLIALYRTAPEFTDLAPRSREKYQGAFDLLKPLDGMPITQATGDFLYGLRDKIAAKHKRSMANTVLIVLRLVFNCAIRRGKCRVNPAQAVELIHRPRNAPVINRPWRPEELASVLEAAPAWLRVPIMLAAYTGLRESDVLNATWAIYDGHAIETRQQKTGRPIWVPVHSDLRRMLDAVPRSSVRIVVGARGLPIARSTLTVAFFGLLKRLREEGKIGPGLSFHGLRHTFATVLAEQGLDPRGIADALGQETTRMGDHYSRQANRRHTVSAAIERWENHMENRGIKC